MRQLIGNDIEVNIVDYGSWALLTADGEVKKIYTGRILSIIQKIRFIRRCLRFIYPKLLKNMIRDVGVVDCCYILFVHPYVASNYLTIRKYSRRLLVHYAGSDFFRTVA